MDSGEKLYYENDGRTDGCGEQEGGERADIAARLKGFGGLEDKELPQATGPKPGFRHLYKCVCMCVA